MDCTGYVSEVRVSPKNFNVKDTTLTHGVILDLHTVSGYFEYCMEPNSVLGNL